MNMEPQSLFEQPQPKKQEVVSSSREVYAVLKASGTVAGNQLKVLKSLDDYASFHSPTSPTARELHAWMHETGRCGSDPNETQPRLSELEDKGYASKCADNERRHCAVGQRKVRVFTWSITPEGREALKRAEAELWSLK